MRIALTPFAVKSILGGAYGKALAIFVIAGITDALDGVLARKFGWSTRAGAYLDPIADKVLLVAVYLCLGVGGLLPWWLVAIVLGRDVLILLFSGAVIVFTPHRHFSPSVWGKISTTVQMVTAVTVIASRAIPPPTLVLCANVLVGVTAAATVWSGIHYSWVGRQMLREPRQLSRIDGGPTRG